MNRNLVVVLLLNIALVSSAQPPMSPVIHPAEFEPMTGVLVRYPSGVATNVVAEISQDAEVKIIVTNASVMATCIQDYQNSGVNIANCTFLFAPSNTGLTRDYGPWYVFDGNNQQVIVDPITGNSRPLDERIPIVLGDSLNIPVFQLPLTCEGGNIMTDGMGKGMSVPSILGQNPGWTVPQIDSVMHAFLGWNTYDIFSWPDQSGIWHIDCVAKLLNPGRVLVKHVSNPPYILLDSLAEYIGSLRSAYGRPYEVFRVNAAQTTPYTNSLIVNNKALVPLTGNPLDQQALAAYHQAMPGYEVHGFVSGWGAYDALHCRTMGITDQYMLRIIHIPLWNRENDGQNYRIAAHVHAYSNQPLSPGMPQIAWHVAGGPWVNIPMTHTAGDSFVGYIPQQPNGTDVEYYLHAEDASGRRENHPYIGSGNPHRFHIGIDNQPPSITLRYRLQEVFAQSWPLTLTVDARDNLEVSQVTLEWLLNGMAQDTLEMVLQPLSAAWYDATLTAPVHNGDQIQMRVKAIDTAQAPNTAYDPPQGYYTITVVGDMRTCVWNPTGAASGIYLYSLLQRGGVQAYYTEIAPVNFNRFECMFISLGGYNVIYDLTQTQVNQLVAYINNDHNVYMEGADCWAYAPYHTIISQAFGIIGINDGSAIQNPLLGVDSTFTAGMSFNYLGLNSFIDRIAPAPGAQTLFTHADTAFTVAQQSGNHKTIGSCFQLYGLDGNNIASTKTTLFREIMEFFYGLGADRALDDENLSVASDLLPGYCSLHEPFPNPFNPATVISSQLRKPIGLRYFREKSSGIGERHERSRRTQCHFRCFGSGVGDLPVQAGSRRIQRGQQNGADKVDLRCNRQVSN